MMQANKQMRGRLRGELARRGSSQGLGTVLGAASGTYLAAGGTLAGIRAKDAAPVPLVAPTVTSGLANQETYTAFQYVQYCQEILDEYLAERKTV
jgi:hypothetical protein